MLKYSWHFSILAIVLMGLSIGFIAKVDILFALILGVIALILGFASGCIYVSHALRPSVAIGETVTVLAMYRVRSEISSSPTTLVLAVMRENGDDTRIDASDLNMVTAQIESIKPGTTLVRRRKNYFVTYAPEITVEA